jgi:hypothetical protein
MTRDGVVHGETNFRYEKLCNDFLAGKGIPADTRKKLEVLTAKTNKEGIGDQSLVPVFIKPFYLQPVTLQFSMEFGEGDAVPEWLSRYDETRKIIEIQPLAIFKLLRDAKTWAAQLPGLTGEEFVVARYRSFLVELAKMATREPLYLLFLVVLQRVAFLLEIAHLEKRGGIIEVAEGESYHTMLWAFKELEVFLRKTYGLNVRAHYGMSWYESDWITGR